jgi:hypothetical protein
MLEDRPEDPERIGPLLYTTRAEGRLGRAATGDLLRASCAARAQVVVPAGGVPAAVPDKVTEN